METADRDNRRLECPNRNPRCRLLGHPIRLEESRLAAYFYPARAHPPLKKEPPLCYLQIQGLPTEAKVNQGFANTSVSGGTMKAQSYKTH